MKELPLTRGYVAIVDDDDYERVCMYKWRASVMKPQMDGMVNVYAMRTVTVSKGKETTEYLHRAILRAEKGTQVDHINRNGLDNRKNNLRICTNAENNRNRLPSPGGASKFKGVVWSKCWGKWRSTIRENGKKRHLGYFANEIDAANAYDVAAVRLFGEFSVTNRAAFPELAGEVARG